MGREERQALLHEGSGSAVMSAYVEIIFDNSDGRFPTGKDELILRRTIGLKKDEYSLDRKSATQTDVMNLLESAGFSRSNPYYIVPQGRVTALTNMKDAERLTLLKEVAGTQVYETRRTESLKIMNDTNNKRAKIDETLESVEERLGELEQEKEELRGYQEKDKERRCLEYTYYHREQVAVLEALEELEESRQDGIESTDENRQAFIEGESAISEQETEINQLNRKLDLLKIDRRELEEDRKESAKAQAKVELEVKALIDGQMASEQARQRHQNELQVVKQEIAKKDAELAVIVPEFTTVKATETNVKADLDNAEATRQRLYAKQGRSAHFNSKTERDKWLKKEINELNNTIATQKTNRIDACEEVGAVESEIKDLEGQIAELRERLEGWSGNRQALSEEVASAKDALERLSEERKVLRRDEDKLESATDNARYEMDKATRELSHSMDGNTARGLATVRRIKQEHNLVGAYGTIAELLHVDEHYRTAVEQTAGNSLFHYVVDNEKTATLLVNALQEQNGGRVTFMPLAQLRPTRPPNFPKAHDAIPMIDKIHFDPKYEKAFAQVFGKTIICPDLTVAGQYARSHSVNAITPDGDTTNKKGAMTGGFIDPRKSRLEAVRAAEKWRAEYDAHRARAREVKSEIDHKDQGITTALSDLHRLEQKSRQLDDSFDPLKAELRGKSTHLEQLKDQVEAKTRRRENIDSMLRQYEEQISAFQAELSSDFKKALSRQEEDQLEHLNVKVQDLKSQWNELSKVRRELENRKNLLDVDLRENLRLKLDQLNSQGFGDTANHSSSTLKEAQRELKRLTKVAAVTQTKLVENEHDIEGVEAKIENLRKEKSHREQRQQEIAKAIESFQKRMEKSIAKKALLAASAAECAKNIRDLGTIPQEAFEKFGKIDNKTVSCINS
jgi:structural maintenance of chromosome 3 (chondroitin sulfate proteoglycan 6)